MSEQTKFTPGPWHATKRAFIMAGNKYIGQVNSNVYDAVLIAAAPEMYEALDKTAKYMDGCLLKQTVELREKLLAALKKARGA